MDISKEQAVEASRRKNRAIRKLLRVDRLEPSTKLTAITLIDFLNAKSGYQVAWPSVRRLAERLGVSTRTMKRYLKTVRNLEIFTTHRLSPKEASAFIRDFGYDVTFPRCRKYAPTIYLTNRNHPLWDSRQKLAADVELELLERSVMHIPLSMVAK